MHCVGQLVSHAMQKMQSGSLTGSDLSLLYAFQSALPCCTTLSFPVPACPGLSSHSKTKTGQTSIQTPSAMQASQSTATLVPWIPSAVGYGLLSPSSLCMPAALIL